jgi:hypothetical protein
MDVGTVRDNPLKGQYKRSNSDDGPQATCKHFKWASYCWSQTVTMSAKKEIRSFGKISGPPSTWKMNVCHVCVCVCVLCVRHCVVCVCVCVQRGEVVHMEEA